MVRDRQLSAEVAVLGSLLLEPKLAGDAFSKISPEAFSSSTYRTLFSAARELFFSGKPIDPVILCDSVGKAYEATIAQILQLTPTAANYEIYVELLLSESRLAGLQDLGARLMNAPSYEEGLQLLTKAAGLLTSRPQRRSSTYTEMIHEYLDRQGSPEPLDYIDWGFPQLNKLKVSPGRFVILGADSSVGKTAFALQLAINVARSGKRVGFFSYETDRPDAIDRILANTAGVRLDRSQNKSLSAADMQRVTHEGFNSEKYYFRLTESAEYPVDELRVETLAERYDVIFIDYLQLIPSKRRGSDWEEVSEVSMALHSMAQRLGVTIVALSQVTLPEKGKNGVRPHVCKDNLRGSRQLKMDADIILMMDYEDTGRGSGPRILIVDKNKNGPLAYMVMGFDPIHMRFSFFDRQGKKQTKALPNDSIDGQVELKELPDEDDDLPPGWKGGRG